MVKIDCMMVGELLVGDGNEVVYIDLFIGLCGSLVEFVFVNVFMNNKDGFILLLVVVVLNLLIKLVMVMFNKVMIKGVKQVVQMFGFVQCVVVMVVVDCVEDGMILVDEVDNLFICVGVFIYWLVEDDVKIQDYNYCVIKELIKCVVVGMFMVVEVVVKKGLLLYLFVVV